jgi:ribonuclease HII
MLVIGVDENGLGPLLGPLVVTAAVFDVDEYDQGAMWQALPGRLRAADSKQIFSRGTMGTAERHTLAWLAALGAETATHQGLVRSICVPLPWSVPCDHAEPEPCRPGSVTLPVWRSSTAMVDQREIRERLGAGGVRPVAVRALAACAGAFNRAVIRPGMNKLRLDFEMMLHLVAGIADEADRPIEAVCGKVGSTRRYGQWLDGLGRFLWSALEETPKRSSYRLSGLGTVSFVRDADASHLPVAVASMVGKYLRELAMLRLNIGLGRDPAHAASGYRDPVTARFAEETAERRKAIGLAEHCFYRSC